MIDEQTYEQSGFTLIHRRDSEMRSIAFWRLDAFEQPASRILLHTGEGSQIERHPVDTYLYLDIERQSITSLNGSPPSEWAAHLAFGMMGTVPAAVLYDGLNPDKRARLRLPYNGLFPEEPTPLLQALHAARGGILQKYGLLSVLSLGTTWEGLEHERQAAEILFPNQAPHRMIVNIVPEPYNKSLPDVGYYILHGKLFRRYEEPLLYVSGTLLAPDLEDLVLDPNGSDQVHIVSFLDFNQLQMKMIRQLPIPVKPE